MKIDSDNKERLRVALSFLLEIYKVGTGSLLSVFVVHSCDGEDAASNSTAVTTPPECGVSDSFYPSTRLGAAALAMNATSLAAVCVLYTVELLRENWMISTLDISKEHADNYLDDVAPPAVLSRLRMWNNRYWKSACAAGCLAVCNVVVSGIFLGNHFRGSSTVTAGLSFTLLVAMKLWGSFSRARKDNRNKSASSAYLTENASFNVLDPDYMATHYAVHSSGDGESKISTVSM